MPNYQDAFISDVFIIVDESPELSFDKVVENLKQAGVEVSDVHKDQCVVEGSVDSGKVKTIDGMPGVEAVRTRFTYVADYPAGDPRDLDKVDREAE
jgi:hypothetical protein